MKRYTLENKRIKGMMGSDANAAQSKQAEHRIGKEGMMRKYSAVLLSLLVLMSFSNIALADDHGQGPDGATPVTINSTTSGRIETAGDYDWFVVDIPSPGTLAVYSKGKTNTYGYFRESTSSTMYRDDNSGNGTNFSFDLEDASAGTYYIAVRHSSASGTGSYRVVVELTLPGYVLHEYELRSDDNFGRAVAKGDFNNDGHEDLAVGIPNAKVAGKEDAGMVTVYYGGGYDPSSGEYSSHSLLGPGQDWDQDKQFINGACQEDDRFGASLAVGYFNHDDYADLAVGVPGEDLGSVQSAGMVNIIYGSKDGLTAVGDQTWYQGKNGIRGAHQFADHFGASLTAGDFDGNGYTDLAVGVPSEDLGNGNVRFAGMVNVIYGSYLGLTADGNQSWHQGKDGIRGSYEKDDFFGASLAAGDFDGDGYADLAVGVPFEDLGSVQSAGMVNIIYGSKDGLTGVGNQSWYQSRYGIQDSYESNDHFGSSLTTGYFNDDAYADLAVGVPSEDLSRVEDVGMVNIIYGSKDGLTGVGNQSWYQNKAGVLGHNESDDRFGSSLTTLDVNGDGLEDLAVGVPGQDVDGVKDAGIVTILSGANNGLSALGNQEVHQNSHLVEELCEEGDAFGSVLSAGDFDNDGWTDLVVGVPFEDSYYDENDGMVNILFFN